MFPTRHIAGPHEDRKKLEHIATSGAICGEADRGRQREKIFDNFDNFVTYEKMSAHEVMQAVGDVEQRDRPHQSARQLVMN